MTSSRPLRLCGENPNLDKTDLMKLILYNDDFGLTYGLTNAVRESFLNGTTTCASIRTNGLAFRYAVDEIMPTIPELELGLHVNLSEGPPNADPSKVPRLIDRRGYLKRSFLDCYFALRRDKDLLKEIEIEIRAQFEKAASCGLAFNHVNGNQHIHMIPSIFNIICQMMNDYGVKFIRIPLEPFFFSLSFEDNLYMMRSLNFLKYFLLRRLSLKALVTMKRYDLRCVGCFVGILNTGRMTVNVVKSAVKRLEQCGIDAAEVLFHPADIDHQKDIDARGNRIPHYYYLKERRIEKEHLLSLELREFLVERGIELVNHKILQITNGKSAQNHNGVCPECPLLPPLTLQNLPRN
jgi:predicted glycoside hydrolase/deacetylase ChbG (UPF0249 family)